jgi:hypothetical protein
VAVTVGGIGELERDEGTLASVVVAGSVGRKLVDQLAADQSWQEIVDDDPLVVPSGGPGSLVEQVAFGDAVGAQAIDEAVVHLQHRQVQLRHEKVNVVTRVANQRQPLLVAR